MKVIKTKKQRGSFLLRIAIFAFAVYSVVALVNQQVQISEKRQQLASIKQQIQIQKVKNEDIKHALSTGENGNGDYIERVAREGLGLAKPGERVFVNIAGK
jgi:cell division protein FtsB